MLVKGPEPPHANISALALQKCHPKLAIPNSGFSVPRVSVFSDWELPFLDDWRSKEELGDLRIYLDGPLEGPVPVMSGDAGQPEGLRQIFRRYRFP